MSRGRRPPAVFRGMVSKHFLTESLDFLKYYGFLSFPMVSYGFLWIPMSFYGFLRCGGGLEVLCTPILWILMDSYDFLWNPMDPMVSLCSKTYENIQETFQKHKKTIPVFLAKPYENIKQILQKHKKTI